jgi:hypothetical protein
MKEGYAVVRDGFEWELVTVLDNAYAEAHGKFECPANAIRMAIKKFGPLYEIRLPTRTLLVKDRPYPVTSARGYGTDKGTDVAWFELDSVFYELRCNVKTYNLISLMLDTAVSKTRLDEREQVKEAVKNAMQRIHDLL